MLSIMVVWLGGTPVPGAVVRITGQGSKTSDTDGRVTFDSLAAGEYFAVARTPGTASVPGLGISIEPIYLDRSSYAKVVLTLRPVSVSQGTVADEAGAPVAGAALYPRAITATPGLLARYAAPGEIEVEIKNAQAELMAVTTDAAGHFAIPLWPETALRFRVRAPGYQTLATGFLPAGKPAEFVLARGLAVSGIVTEQETGAPVAQVRLKITGADVESGECEPVTDSHGQFQVGGLKPEPYTVVLNYETLLLQSEGPGVTFNPAENRRLELTAITGGAVTGRAVDETSGEGIPEVEIRCDTNMERKVTFTDASGAYTLTGLCGNVHIRPEWPDAYEFIQRNTNESGKDLRIPPGETVAGIDFSRKRIDWGVFVAGRTVDSQGSPVPGAFIVARDSEFSFFIKRAADFGGNFRIDGLPVTGSLYLSAAFPKLASKTVGPLTVDARGLEDVELKMTPTGSISGTVLDAYGHPYGALDWRVNVSCDRYPAGCAAVNEDGSFRFFDLAEGAYELFLDKHPKVIYLEIQLPSATVDLKPGENVTDVRIASGEDTRKTRAVEEHVAEPSPGFDRNWSVEGKVFAAATGEPITDFQYDFHDLGTSHGNGRNGSFSEQARSRHVKVVVEAPGYISHTQEVDESQAPNGKASVTIRLAAGCVVEGAVLDASMEPLPGASVHINQVWRGFGNASFTKTVRTDKDGRYRIDTLPSEPVKLFGEHPSHARGRITVTPVPGSVTQADIVLPEGGIIEGHIFLGGAPVKGAYFQYGKDEEPSMATSCKADETGYYRMEHVPAGEVRTCASTPDDNPVKSRRMNETVEVNEGQTVALDFRFPEASARIESMVTIRGEIPEYAQATVVLTTAGTDETFNSDPSTTGIVEVASLPAGQGQLVLMAHTQQGKASLWRHMAVSLKEGEVLRQDVDFAGTASLGGVIAGLSKFNEVAIQLFEGSDLPQEKDFFVSSVASCYPQEASYLIENLSAGSYTLYAGKYPVTAASGIVVPITIVEGEQKILDLDLSGIDFVK